MFPSNFELLALTVTMLNRLLRIVEILYSMRIVVTM